MYLHVYFLSSNKITVNIKNMLFSPCHTWNHFVISKNEVNNEKYFIWSIYYTLTYILYRK